MGKIQKHFPVKLVIGFISADKRLFSSAEKTLSRKFGKIDFSSPTLPFDFTDYYKAEMGQGLKRKFISFQRLIPPQRISEIKLFTNGVEKRFARANKRRINIDPGYLNSAKLVLATTKDFSHRIYLSKGIFAELTLFYEDKEFHPLKWTYPDYCSRPYHDILNRIRDIYVEQIKAKA